MSNEIWKTKKTKLTLSGIAKKSIENIELAKTQSKLDTAQADGNEILEQAKKDSDHLVVEMNDKFHKSSEIKKNLAENIISQMKEAALKGIKDVSIKVTLWFLALNLNAAAIPPKPEPITIDFIWLIYSFFKKL